MTHPDERFFYKVTEETAARIQQLMLQIADHTKAITADDEAGIVVEASMAFTARLVACCIAQGAPASIDRAVVEHFANMLKAARQEMAKIRQEEVAH